MIKAIVQPAAEDYLPHPLPPDVSASRRASGGTILLVDDDAGCIDIEQEMLAHYGYQVVTLEHSTSAVELIRDNPGGIDLVVLNMDLSDMTGEQFADAVTALRNDMPVVVCPGTHTAGTVLQKPIAMIRMVDTVRTLVEGCLPEH